MRLRHGFVPRLNLRRIVQRPQNRRPQHPLAHRRLARIERAEERHAIVLPLKERLDQLQIAHRHLVQLQRRRVLLEFQRIDVQRLVLLRGAHVMQHRAGRNRRRLMPLQPKTLERPHIQLPLHAAARQTPRVQIQSSTRVCAGIRSNCAGSSALAARSTSLGAASSSLFHRLLPRRLRRETPPCETRPSKHPAAPPRKPMPCSLIGASVKGP